MINTFRQILEITKDTDLKSEFGLFEEGITTAIHPLVIELSKDIRNGEIVSILDHLTKMDSWRERVVKFHALASCFVNHCKSDHFIVAKTKGQTEFDRQAYQKKLYAGFQGLETYLEGLLDSVDSRINTTKKILGMEDGGNTKLK